MRFEYNDGGRSKYFQASNVGDCAVRAIAIATEQDYKVVYDALKKLNGGKSCRNGTPKNVDKKYLQQLGWIWHPTMKIGSGCRVHLANGEIPMNERLVVQVSGHLVAVINGVVQDTFDCTRGESRCVYGYWTAPKPAPKNANVTFEIIEYKDKTYRIETKHMAYHFRDGLMQECEAKDLYQAMLKIADLMNNKYNTGCTFVVG